MREFLTVSSFRNQARSPISTATSRLIYRVIAIVRRFSNPSGVTEPWRKTSLIRMMGTVLVRLCADDCYPFMWSRYFYLCHDAFARGSGCSGPRFAGPTGHNRDFESDPRNPIHVTQPRV